MTVSTFLFLAVCLRLPEGQLLSLSDGEVYVLPLLELLALS